MTSISLYIKKTINGNDFNELYSQTHIGKTCQMRLYWVTFDLGCPTILQFLV